MKSARLHVARLPGALVDTLLNPILLNIFADVVN